MIDLVIVAPLENIRHQVPRGFTYTDQVFSEAKLNDPISAAHNLTYELHRVLGYLDHRYPRRIRTRWIELWSLGGMWLAFRYKLRSFPAIILNQQEVLTGESLKFQAFSDYISEKLSQIQA